MTSIVSDINTEAQNDSPAPTPAPADAIETFENVIDSGGTPTDEQAEAAVEEFIEKLVDGDDEEDQDDDEEA
jgi:hypothetical protein